MLAAGEELRFEYAAILSSKTVEFHLGNIYRRLGIRSRRDLIRLFARKHPSSSSPAE